MNRQRPATGKAPQPRRTNLVGVGLLAALIGGGVACGQAALVAGFDSLLPDARGINRFNRPGTLTILSADGQVIQKLGPATREKVASGVKHADNITPCLLGGVTLIRSIHPLDIISLSAPELFITVVHPQIEVRTADARQILKKEVPLKQAIKQWGNIAGLVAGLMQGDHALIGRSLEVVIIEPVRSILIPGFEETKRRSLEAGALGGGISGSGPSIFMLSKDEKTAAAVEQEMKKVYTTIGIDYKTYLTKLNGKGITTL